MVPEPFCLILCALAVPLPTRSPGEGLQATYRLALPTPRMVFQQEAGKQEAWKVASLRGCDGRQEPHTPPGPLGMRSTGGLTETSTYMYTFVSRHSPSLLMYLSLVYSAFQEIYRERKVHTIYMNIMNTYICETSELQYRRHKHLLVTTVMAKKPCNKS